MCLADQWLNHAKSWCSGPTFIWMLWYVSSTFKLGCNVRLISLCVSLAWVNENWKLLQLKILMGSFLDKQRAVFHCICVLQELGLVITGTLPVFNKTKSTNKVLWHKFCGVKYIEHVFSPHSTVVVHVTGYKHVQ